jgi:hypothetical protein
MITNHCAYGMRVAVILLVFLFAGGQTARSQFHITSYIPERFTDFQWQATGSMDFSGYHNDRSDENPYGYPEARETKRDAKYIYLSSDARYRYLTVPRYLTVSGNLQSSFYQPGTGAGGSAEVSQRTWSSFDAGWYPWSEMLLSTVADVRWQYDQAVSHYNPKGDFRGYQVHLAVLPGWGHVYEGRYAATALYMVDELRKNGVLRREPRDDELLALTKLIHTYRQTHAIDKRLFKIEALTAILQYLQQQGIIDNAGPYGYVLIQDIWDYFPDETRPFGLQVRGGFGILYLYSTKQSTDEESRGGLGYHAYSYTHSENQDPYVTVAARYYRPLGLRWQADFDGDWRQYLNSYNHWRIVYIHYQPLGSESTVDELTQVNLKHSLAVSGAIRYIIDSRSSLRWTTTYQNSHYNSKPAPPASDMRREFEAEALWTHVSFDYRVAIPTTFRVDLNLGYDEQGRRLRTRAETGVFRQYSLRFEVIHNLY